MAILILSSHGVRIQCGQTRLFKCPDRNPPPLKFCSALSLAVEGKISFEYSLFNAAKKFH